MKIKPAKLINGKIELPGDKSISHRAALIAAMATGETRIENFSPSADCASTLSCLGELGVEIKREDSSVLIQGVGKSGFQKPLKPLDCGNSGTTMRLLAGILAGQNFESVLIGDESLSKRPMKRIIEPLEAMGAKIESQNGCAPLKIYSKSSLKAISYELPVASAQLKSCVLLAGLNASGKTFLSEPPALAGGRNDENRNPEFRPSAHADGSDSRTRDHTERMLRFFGVDIEKNAGTICVSGENNLNARDIEIPGDISSAAFFIVAAACLKNSVVLIENIGLNPTRTAIIGVLRRCGVEIEISDEREICNEPRGNISVSGDFDLKNDFGSGIICGDVTASLIDEIPILAVFGTQIENGLEVRNAEELRVKESDRISAMCENLQRMSAKVEEFPDGFRIERSDLKGAKIDSFGDHRIAMAFAIAALFATGETEIAGAECADVSFPGFFDVLKQMAKNDREGVCQSF